MTAALVILFALVCGWLSRMCGGGAPHIGSKDLLQWLTTVPYALVLWGHWIPAAVAVAFAGLAKVTGHGRGQSLGEPMKPGSTPEKIEWLIPVWLQDRLPTYWYKALILLALGLLRSLPAGALYGFAVNPLGGVLLALTGFGMPLAYMIGWAIPPAWLKHFPPNMNEPTNFGEFGTDFFPALALGFLIFG